MKYRPSPRFREYVNKVMSCGHWMDAEQAVGNHSALLTHIDTGATVNYALHDGGNDKNSPRNFAKDAERICGCQFVEHRNRRRSRKRLDTTDPQVEKARARARAEADRRHAEARRQRAEEERAAEIHELKEACRHASTALRQNPNDTRLRAHFDRLRAQLATKQKSVA